MPIFAINFTKNVNFDIFVVSILTSLSCQLGDLFFSYLKRKAKIKDYSNILPGHGGVIDRLDGILSLLPANSIKIAEGGIKDKYTFNKVKELKYDALILGSIFLKQENPINFVENLIKE